MVVSYEIEGSIEGVEDRNVSVVDATPSRLDVEVFFLGRSIKFLPPIPVKDSYRDKIFNLGFTKSEGNQALCESFM